MIDPKLNEISVERSGRVDTAADDELTDAQRAELLKKSRAGLSINDTIAGDTNLSVGSRGVDTSGVSTGSGAGAGMTMTTPGQSSSPAPTIVPGARGSGTNVRADVQPTGTASNTETGRAASHDSADREIAARAYECWCERGCPEGSPEVDWNRASDEIRTRRLKTSAASA